MVTRLEVNEDGGADVSRREIIPFSKEVQSSTEVLKVNSFDPEVSALASLFGAA